MSSGARAASARLASRRAFVLRALAGVKQRAVRRPQPRQKRLERRRIRRQRQGLHWRRSAARVGAFGERFRSELHQHRARLAGEAQRMRLTHRRIHLRAGRHPDHRLHDRRRHRRLVNRLQLENRAWSARRRARHMDERHGVEPGLGDAGKCKREPGAWDGEQDSRSAGGARVTIRHEGRGGFRGGAAEPQGRPPGRRVQPDVLAAGQPEDGVGAKRTQGGADALGAVHRSFPGLRRKKSSA